MDNLPEKSNTKSKKLLWRLLALLAMPFVAVAIYGILALTYSLPQSMIDPPMAPPLPRDIPAQQVGSTARPPVSVPSEKFNNESEYLSSLCDQHPKLEAAALYLELIERFDREKILEQFDHHFSDPITSMPTYLQLPYSPQQAKWLRNQSGFLDVAHRLSRTGFLPAPTLRERIDYINRYNAEFPYHNFHLLQQSTELIATESRLDYQEHDYAGAVRSIQDAYDMAGLLCGDETLLHQLILIGLVNVANRPVKTWIEDPEFPAATLGELGAVLDNLDPTLFPSDQVRRMFVSEYLELRAEAVHVMQQHTWRVPMYGWGGLERAGESMCGWPVTYTTYWDLPLLGITEVPEIPKIIHHSLRAMHNRRNSAPALKELDDYFLKAIELVQLPYPRIKPSEAKLSGASNTRYFLLPKVQQNLLEPRVRGLAAETRMHLNRLGLGLRVNESHTMAQRQERLAGKPHHPWRDPFSEQAVRMNESSSSTLLYSLGPDLTDQNGMLTYDPTNGTTSAGDITIHVPEVRP